MKQVKNFKKEFLLTHLAIRKAKLQEVDKIHEVLKQAFKGLEGRGYSTQAIKAAVVPIKEIAKRIRLGADVLVAELGDEIIGTVTGFMEHESMYVCSLAVHPAYQNLGIARQLMRSLETIARKKSCYKLFLYTGWAMKEAIGLYESLGYVREGYLSRHFYGEDLIVFSKILKG
ncbi:MAG: GNAT family N-acetyltransferase [Candidatus Bathyarchaeia archaeon]